MLVYYHHWLKGGCFGYIAAFIHAKVSLGDLAPFRPSYNSVLAKIIGWARMAKMAWTAVSAQRELVPVHS